MKTIKKEIALALKAIGKDLNKTIKQAENDHQLRLEGKKPWLEFEGLFSFLENWEKSEKTKVHNMKVLTCDFKSENFNEDFVKSLRETGFAVVINHHISKKLINNLYQKWASIFHDSMLKFCYVHDKGSQAGYFPFKSENAKGATSKDLKEFWHIYCNRTNWRNTVPLEGEYSEYIFSDLEFLALELLRILELKTPIANKNNINWTEAVNGSENTLFRILHYPPLGSDIEEGAVRAAAHEDINLITLLPVATAPGLQVKDIEGNWHSIDVDNDNAIIVNAGDMLQELTNGYYKSTTHQVLNPTGEAATQSRYSMPLFLHPHSNYQLSIKHTAKSYLMERLMELGLI